MTDMMKAALIYGPMDVRVIDAPKPEAGPGEVLIRIKICMTAGTTVKQYVRGYPGWAYPHGFGYEWAGEIEEVGEGVDKSLIGKKVSWDRAGRTCNCFFCVRGKPNLCASRAQVRKEPVADDPEKGKITGMYKEYDVLPESAVKVLPEHLSLEDACMIPTVTVAQHGNNNVEILQGDSVAVIGAGAIGLTHMMLSHLRGAQTIAIDMNKSRLHFAKKAGIADHIIHTGKTEEAQERIKELNINDGWGPDVTIEAVGLPQTWEMAFDLVRRGGQVLEYGGCEPKTTITLDTYKLHYHEITIVSSTTASPIDWIRAYNLIERGMIKPSIFITDRIPITRIKEALELHRTGKGLKYAVIP